MRLSFAFVMALLLLEACWLSFMRIVVYMHTEDDMRHLVKVTAENRREGGLPG